MSEIFEKNVKALTIRDPMLASSIFGITTNIDYEIYLDKNDAANINIIEKKGFVSVYMTRPIDETINFVEKLEEKFSRNPYIYCYGIGNGVASKMLLSNQIHERIFVIEPEIELIYIAFNLIDYSDEILSGRFVVKSAMHLDFNTITQYLNGRPKIYAKVYDLFILSPYYEKYYDNILAINQLFTRSFEHLIYCIGNDAKDSLIGLEHHISNLDRMVTTPILKELFLKANKIAEIAVIVSTGPSLTKQLPLLKSIQNKVTIICPDASLPILYQHGIKPDIVATLERVPATAHFYENIPYDFQKDITFVVSSVVHKNLFKVLIGGTLLMSMRGFGYCKYFQLHSWGYLGRGMSASNMCYEIAVGSDFDKIVFIGQDLAFADNGISHAGGHVFGTDNFQYSENDEYIEKYGGGGLVRARLDWRLFLNYFERDIEEVNTVGKICTYNATEGGARIPGTIEIPFQEFIDSFIDEAYEKESLKLESLSSKEIKLARKKIKSKISKMLKVASSVKAEAEKIFLDVVQIIEHIEYCHEQNEYKLIDFAKIRKIIKKIDKVKKHFENDEFQLMFFDVIQAMIMYQEVDLAVIQIRDIKTDEDKKAKLIDWLYAHRYWLFSLAGVLDNVINVIQKSYYFKEK